jgi:hypothetical protein
MAQAAAAKKILVDRNTVYLLVVEALLQVQSLAGKRRFRQPRALSQVAKRVFPKLPTREGRK